MARLLVAVAALLSAASAHAQPGVDWSKAEAVNLLMVDNQFVPDHLSFRHGMPYRLHLENRGKDLHEFTAPEFLADAVVRDPGALANAGQESWCSRAGSSTSIWCHAGRHVPAGLRRP